MRQFNFLTYMKDVAERLPELAHVDNDRKRQAFYRSKSILDVGELQQNLTGSADMVLVVEESRMGRRYSPHFSTKLNRRTYTFAVLKRQPKSNDFGADQTCLDAIEDVVRKIESKLDHDCFYDNTHPGDELYGLRDLLSAEGYNETDFTLGPGSFIGIIVSFAIEDSANIRYNKSDWSAS